MWSMTAMETQLLNHEGGTNATRHQVVDQGSPF